MLDGFSALKRETAAEPHPLGGAKWELFAGFAHDSWHKVRQRGKHGRFRGRLWSKVSYFPIPWVGLYGGKGRFGSKENECLTVFLAVKGDSAARRTSA